MPAVLFSLTVLDFLYVNKDLSADFCREKNLLLI